MAVVALLAALWSPITVDCATQVAEDVRYWFHNEMTVEEQQHLTAVLDSRDWPRMVRFLNNRGLLTQPSCPDQMIRYARNPAGRRVLVDTFRQVTSHFERPGWW